MRNIPERESNLKGMLVDLIDRGYNEFELRESTHLSREQISSIFNGNNNLALYDKVLPAWCDVFIRHYDELMKPFKKAEQQRIYEQERGWPDMNIWDADDAAEV